MARINLRPWREELRAEKQREFLATMAVFAVIALVYIVIADRWLNDSIDDQRARNSFLSQEIAKVDEKIKEIAELEKRREELIERMTVIQSLQGNRPVIVHVFDEIVRTMPDGVYYSKLSNKGDVVSMVGLAESNNRISSLMRRLNASDWFEDPNLTSVKALDEEDAGEMNTFDLTVKRKGILSEDEEGEDS